MYHCDTNTLYLYVFCKNEERLTVCKIHFPMLSWVEKYCHQDVRITITSLLLKRTIQSVRQILLSTTGSQLENHWTVIFIIWTPASYMAEAIHSQCFIHILPNGDENIMAKRHACFLASFPPFHDKCYFYQCYISFQEVRCPISWISEDSRNISFAYSTVHSQPPTLLSLPQGSCLVFHHSDMFS